MIEIYANLFIGDQTDYEYHVKSQDGWYIVHACKEPYHRQAVGYSGRGAPKDHPEYLVARRGNRLILNMVDAPNPSYIPKELVDSALAFIRQGLSEGQRVLVHCNQGHSRSPAIGLLYLVQNTDALPRENFLAAETALRKLYPAYQPANGVRQFMMQNWATYSSNEYREEDDST